jgi:ABC-type multidrug transport system ATPase subunit
MKKNGVTIIFTSHNIEEMNNLADELIALRNGVPTYYGSIDFSGDAHLRSLPDAIRYYTA